MTNRTRALAEFAVGTDYDAFGPDLIAAAIRPIVDTIAVFYAGYSGDAGQILLAHAAANPAPAAGSGRVVGSPGLHTSPATAALTNGTLGHALDYDDEFAGHSHPSVPVVSAMLALPVGEAISGRQLLTAYIAGHEVMIGVAEAMGKQHRPRGWHTTATAGSFGAAAAVGRLTGLSADQMTTAFGIVASMSSGIQRNFGTMTKPLQAGLAARNGVLAVELARLGLTASDDVLSGPKGYLDIYGHGTPEPERLDTLGNPWALLDPGPSLKKYPCCYATHRGIDAVLQLQNDHDIDPTTIDSITCTLPPGGMNSLLYPRPETPLQGKFSMEYTVATALVDREVTLNSFTEQAIARDEIARLLPLIHAAEDPRVQHLDPAHPTDAPPSASGFVELIVRAGGIPHEIQVPYANGSPERPLGEADLSAKFRDCFALAGVDAATAQQIFDALVDLPGVTDVNALLTTSAHAGGAE